MAPDVAKLGAPVAPESSWGLKTGWDASKPSEVRRLRRQIEAEEPETIWLCPECRAFSAINRLNRHK
eukprot:310600-Pyramimonas_sp.AAC.1